MARGSGLVRSARALTVVAGGAVSLIVGGCAAIVGISDVPADDTILGPLDSGLGIDARRFDAPVFGTDGASHFDVTSDVTTRQPDAGPDAPATPLTYQPSNTGSLTFSAANTGVFDLTDESCAIDTSTDSTIQCSGPSPVPMDTRTVTLANGAGTATIYVFTSVRIAAGSTLFVRGPNPLILIALGSVDVAGTIDVSADNYTANEATIAGERATGTGVGAFNSMENQGGGGGAFCGTGGYGFNPNGPAETPGASYGNATIVPIYGGSSGGGADYQSLVDDANGRGGGAIQISAAGTITVQAGGSINANGSGGVSMGDEAGEGAGSGGAILLEAPTIEVRGLLEANGGQGSDPSGDGEVPPTDGGVADDPSCRGGNGGQGAQANGGDGAESDAGYGGGGGGVGWIRLNGTAVTVSGTVTPALGMGCASQGALP